MHLLVLKPRARKLRRDRTSSLELGPTDFRSTADTSMAGLFVARLEPVGCRLPRDPRSRSAAKKPLRLGSLTSDIKHSRINALFHGDSGMTATARAGTPKPDRESARQVLTFSLGPESFG